MTIPPIARRRFEAKVRKTETCWLWSGSIKPNGYGFVRINKVPLQAHRVAYEIANGAIPPGLHIDHLCRVRNCVNPAHLEAVTQAENNRRMRRSHCKRGHAFTEANTLNESSGRRSCRACHALRERRRYARSMGWVS